MAGKKQQYRSYTAFCRVIFDQLRFYGKFCGLGWAQNLYLGASHLTQVNAFIQPKAIVQKRKEKMQLKFWTASFDVAMHWMPPGLICYSVADL